MSGIRVSLRAHMARFPKAECWQACAGPLLTVAPDRSAAQQVTQGLLEQLSGKPRHVQQAARSQAIL